MPEIGAIRKDSSAADDLRTGETAGALKLNAPTPTPSPNRSRLGRAGGWLICAGAAIACGVALFDFCTWWWWHDWRIGAASNTVPMAPSSALILMILGGALLVRQIWEEKASVRLIGFVAAGMAAAPAVIAGLQHVTGVELAWEQWLLRADDTVRGIPVGLMSPLSAGALLLAAISLATLLPPLAERRLLHRAGLVTASLGAVGSIIIALAYASGTPLFYGGGIIPMAFLTAIAFVALDLALLTAAVSGVRRRAEGAGVPRWHPAPPWRGEERNLLIVIGVLALGIALAGFFFLRAQQTAMREQIADQLETIADLKVGQIVNWRNERLGDARLLMQTPVLARSAAALFATPDSAAASTEIRAYIRALRNNYRYDAVVLFDHRMNPRLAVPPTAETSDPRLHALLEAVAGASDVLVSDLHRGVSGDIRLDLVAPIRDVVARPSGQNPAPTQSAATPVGAMLLRINPRDFLYPLIQKWPVPSETGETLLVRREGDEVVYLNDLLHQPGAALTLRRSIRDWQLPAGKGARGSFGVTEGVDYRGVAVLAAVRAVPESSWILVAKQDQAEIYAPLRRQAWAVGGSVAALLLGIALAAALLGRQNTANYLRRELAAETERRSLAERLVLITRHANDGILLFDEDRRILEANERALAAYGYTLEEMRQLTAQDLRVAEVASTVGKDFSAALTADGTVFETIHRRKDGSVFPVEVSARLVAIGDRRHVLSIVRDITQRKEQERQIARLSQLYATLSQVNQAIVRTSTQDGLFRDVCRALVESGGFPMAWIGCRNPISGAIEVAAEHGDDAGLLTKFRIFADDRPEVGGPVGTAIRENRTEVRNDFGSDPDTQPWRAAAAQAGYRGSVALPVRLAGKPTGALVVYAREAGCFGAAELALLEEVASDLSFGLDHVAREAARREVEAALQQSENRYRALMENAPVAIFVNRADRVVLANAACLRLFGATAPEQLLGKSPYELFDAHFHPVLRERIHRLRDPGEAAASIEEKIIRLDGARVDVEVTTGPFRDQGVPAIHVVLSDITERRRTEAKLRQSEALLKIASQHARLGGWTVDLPDYRETWSDEVASIHELPAGVSPGVDDSINFYAPEYRDKIRDVFGACVRDGTPYDVELQILTATGRRVWVRTIGKAVRDADGTIIRVQGALQDISGKKQTEEVLRTSLQEKEALLKEVHHRVKNNLQVIMSLLRLEAGRIEHPVTQTALREMQSRIRSMALLHESLYRSGNFAQVDLAAYLRQLATQLFRAQAANGGTVQLALNLAPAMLEMGQAIPCGLIVNELVTNALKHGFPGDRTGEVRLELQPLDDGSRLRLRVSDTGIGLPPEFEEKRGKSLGLQLVADLARQLGGTLEIRSGPGARFDVIFRPMPSEAAANPRATNSPAEKSADHTTARANPSSSA